MMMRYAMLVKQISDCLVSWSKAEVISVQTVGSNVRVAIHKFGLKTEGINAGECIAKHV